MRPVCRLRPRFPARVKLMQVPAEPVGQPGPFGDKGIPLIDEKPQVPVGPVGTGHR